MGDGGLSRLRVATVRRAAQTEKKANLGFGPGDARVEAFFDDSL